MTGRLIDRDKLDSFKFRSASERMDLPVDYMVGWNDAVDGIMCNALAVEAIPVEWIKNYIDRTNDTTGYAVADMLSDWEVEHETD